MVLFVALPLVFGLAACGGDSKDKGVASGGTSAKPSGQAGANAPINPGNAPINPQDAQLKFAQCMRENGVNVPDPVAGQPARIPNTGGDTAKLEAATKKCQPILQSGGGLINPNDPKIQDQLVKFAQCMRKNGVDMPDPNPADGGKMQIPSGASQDKLQAAQNACKQFLPGGGPQ
jgi:hypothetical protein